MIRTTKGATLLELLVALGILSIALAPVLRSVHTMTHLFLDYQETAHLTLVQIRLRRLLRNSSLLAQSRLGFRSFQVHQSAQEKASLLRSSKSLQPKADSALLSFLHLSPESQLRIIRSQEVAKNQFRFTACVQGEIGSPRYFLAVSVDAYHLVEAAFSSSKSPNTACTNGQSVRGNFSLLPKNPFSGGLLIAEQKYLTGASLLIPVYRAFSVYLANNKSLRYFSHTSYQNQPLAYKVQSFLAYRSPKAPRTYSVQLTLGERVRNISQLLLSEEAPDSHSYLNHVL